MIWVSVAAMTVIDVVIVVGVCWCFGVFFDRQFRSIAKGSRIGAIAGLVGLSVIALYYFADFAGMHVLPLIVPKAEAIAATEFLHHDLAWLAMFIAVGSLFVGFRSLIKSSLSHVDDLSSSNSKLVNEMEARVRDLDALRRSEERYAFAVSGTRDGLWDRDLVTNELYLSPRWSEIVGYGEGELDGNRNAFESLIHPDDLNSVMEAARAHLDEHVPYDVEFRVRRKNGEYVWIRSKGKAAWSDDGKPLRMAGSISDITEQRRIEEALRQSREETETVQARLIDAVNTLPIGFNLFDADERVILSNDRPGPLQSHLVGPMTPGRQFEDIARTTARSGTVTAAIGREEEWLNERTAYFRDPHGTFEVEFVDGQCIQIINHKTSEGGTVGIRIDITEQKQRERALRDSEERYRLLIETSPDAVFVDQAGKIVYANAAAIELFGADSAARLVGRDLLDLVHCDERDAVEARRRELGGDRQSNPPVERRALRLDGSEFASDARASKTIWRDKPAWLVIMRDVNERKAAEAALRQSQASLVEAQRIGQMGSWERDIETRETRYSAETCRILGLDPETHRPSHGNFLERVYPDDRERVLRETLVSERTGRRFDLTYRIVRPDGSVRHHHSQSEITCDDAGNPVRISGTVQDITDRVQAEQALRDSEERFRRVFEEAGLGIALLDKNGSFIDANPALQKVFDRTHEEMCASSIRSVTAPGDVSGSLEQFRSLRAGEINTARFDKEYLRKDGDTFPARLVSSAVHEDDGELRFTVAMIEDLTERVEAERALRDSEERLDAFFAHAPIGLAIMEDDYSYAKVNAALAEINGAPIEDHRGRQVSDFVSLDLVEKFEREVEYARKREQPNVNIEFSGETLARPGVKRHWIVSRFPIPGREGVPNTTGLVLNEITDRKQAEEEIRTLNAKLEERIEERTAELHEAQAELLKSERLATLGQLNATVSHELRNPLGVINVSASFVARKLGGGDPQLAQAAARIQRNVERCDRIIDDLLDFTRTTDPDLFPVSIDGWLAELLDEEQLPERVTLDRDFGAPGISVAIDSERLRRAVINIYENACQAIEAKKPTNGSAPLPTITVRTAVHDGRIEISISDTGPGIAPEVLPNVFEPLFSTKNFGVGLGLPTVKQIMEQHGGDVEVETEVGRGTTFRLRLPQPPAAVKSA